MSRAKGALKKGTENSADQLTPEEWAKKLTPDEWVKKYLTPELMAEKLTPELQDELAAENTEIAEALFAGLQFGEGDPETKMLMGTLEEAAHGDEPDSLFGRRRKKEGPEYTIYLTKRLLGIPAVHPWRGMVEARKASQEAPAPATKGEAPVDKYRKPSYKKKDRNQPRLLTRGKDEGAMKALNEYFNKRKIPDALRPDLTAQYELLAAEALVRAKALEKAQAPIKPPLPDLTPEQVAALTADTPLGRLQARYENRLREIDLSNDKITNVEQARAANSLAKTYRNLVEQQIKLGLAPQPQDERVLKAQRLCVAFYREQKADHAPRPRGRPSKVAMNALARLHQLRG